MTNEWRQLAESSREPDVAGARVLIADDEQSNRTLYSSLLLAAGYEVLCVEDGGLALAAVQQQLVDVALLDVVMPVRTGFSVCQKIKSTPETRLTPVILVTGLDEGDHRVHGIMCGADDFLTKPVHKHELLARVQSLVRLKKSLDELDNAETVLLTLASSIESKDPYTEGHCQRLSRYSVALAEAIGLPEESKIALRRAGVVHDLGKIAVPEHILGKTSPLNEEEWRVMKRHPEVGEQICRPLKSFRLVLPIIRHHHERLDGTGYPDGLKGSQIPLTAQVLQTVDIFDALTTDRSYRKALPQGEAFRIMRDEARRGWWNSSLIDAFEKLVQSPVIAS